VDRALLLANLNRLFELDLADELLCAFELHFDCRVCWLKSEDALEVGDRELRLEDLDVACCPPTSLFGKAEKIGGEGTNR
jgi:hypothetical protein